MKAKYQKWATFLLVADLLRSGVESLAIADRIGEKRGAVQWCYLLANLPTYVQNEYRKLFLQDYRATPVRISDVKRLYSVFSDEYVDYPDGDGPEFRRVWAAILTSLPTG